MAIESYTSQLERVQATIAKIETTGQAYGIDNRNLTRADLKQLYEREKWLRVQVAREGQGGLRTQYVVPRG